MIFPHTPSNILLHIFSIYRFNTAEIGAMSRDIPYEGKVMVKRMISDPNVDVQNHWKVGIQ